MSKQSDNKLGDELIKKNAPEFVKMVDTAVHNNNHIVMLNTKSFEGEPELMYAAVYYAVARDVMVTFHNHLGPHPLDKSLKRGGDE